MGEGGLAEGTSGEAEVRWRRGGQVAGESEADERPGQEPLAADSRGAAGGMGKGFAVGARAGASGRAVGYSQRTQDGSGSETGRL